MKTKLAAMISSTAIDLPEHRKQVVEACLRAGVLPIGMEHLPARDASGVQVSLEMVDEADIYIGIYAWRYGWVPDVPGVPNPDKISITEMEFNRALERKERGELKDILIFVMHDDHPIVARDKEDSIEVQEKLRKFKELASANRVRLIFKSAEDLRGLVVQSLNESRHRIEETESKLGEPTRLDLHPTYIIPEAPGPFIAHPYSLLQTKNLIGRQTELNLLTDWVTMNKQVPADTRIFSLVAIGGMGKSALTWKWFNDIAPNELPKIAGRMWWSFYESDAYYENFTIRALAYVAGQSEEAVRKMSWPDREDQLWHILDQQPFLLVLDGLERILLAYARMDAAHLPDEDLDERTANAISGAQELPDGDKRSYLERHRLRQCADVRAGRLLRRFAQVRASRILISSRLYPAELQTETSRFLPKCFGTFLTGLPDDDALNLWRAFGVSGTREQLLPLFRSFGNYPLLIRALAGEVADFRPAPGNFDQWLAKNRGFKPAKLPLKNARTHVLKFALRGLGATQRYTLSTIAAFRMPATWQTLRSVAVGTSASLENDDVLDDEFTELRVHESSESDSTPLALSISEGFRRHWEILSKLTTRVRGRKLGDDADHFAVRKRHSNGSSGRQTVRVPIREWTPCENYTDLDAVLSELEDRGLVGWDRASNRYDLHPIVRIVAWDRTSEDAKARILDTLHKYFSTIATLPNESKVGRVEDLTPDIELYCTLIALGRAKDAFGIFRRRLNEATLYVFADLRLRVELLEMFFPNGIAAEPTLTLEKDKTRLLRWLAFAYHLLGEPGTALRMMTSKGESRLNWAYNTGAEDWRHVAFGACCAGKLRAAEYALRKELTSLVFKTPNAALLSCLPWFLYFSAARGEYTTPERSEFHLERLTAERVNPRKWILVWLLKAQRLLWDGKPHESLAAISKAAMMLSECNRQREPIRANRLYGTAYLGVGELGKAAEYLQKALSGARTINLVEEELPALASLAELHRQLNEHDSSREILEQVWAPAERGPYPLWHADARNILARIERDEKRQGWREAAIAAATRAYELAWCDGPPYAYHYGLTNAKKLLAELGAPEPTLPPFNESKFEPMPEVELNPKDEFWVDPATLDSSV